MNLKKENWTEEDILEFQQFLKTFENPTRKEWAVKILQTKLPVLCMKTKDVKDIINGIQKGNYLSFLDHMVWDFYENTAINGYLINTIQDFKISRHYLDIYSEKVDNWANCDLLTFNTKDYPKEYFSLAQHYIESKKPIVRRIGLYILFNFIDSDSYVDKIYDILDLFFDEKEYYVNMMGAWLLSELFIKRKEKTLVYLSHGNHNKFIINKGIQKCRDSRRVSAEDKELLLKYKIN